MANDVLCDVSWKFTNDKVTSRQFNQLGATHNRSNMTRFTDVYPSVVSAAKHQTRARYCRKICLDIYAQIQFKMSI
jgi:hypothetical protein